MHHLLDAAYAKTRFGAVFTCVVYKVSPVKAIPPTRFPRTSRDLIPDGMIHDREMPTQQQTGRKNAEHVHHRVFECHLQRRP